MKHTVLILVLISLFGIAGCGTMARFSAPVAEPVDGASYVYGRFERVETSTDPGVNKIGLVLTSLDGGRDYTIRFRKQQTVFAIAIEPGDYRISKWLCTYGFSDEISNEQPIAADGESCHCGKGAASPSRRTRSICSLTRPFETTVVPVEGSSSSPAVDVARRQGR